MASIAVSIKGFFKSLWSKVRSFFSGIYNFWFKPKTSSYSYVYEILQQLTTKQPQKNVTINYKQFMNDAKRSSVIINDEDIANDVENHINLSSTKFPKPSSKLPH